MADLIGAALGLALSTAVAPAAEKRPVILRTEKVEGGVLVRVIGASTVRSRVRYRLELNGGGPSGNRVNQAGSAQLGAGAAPQVLATIRIDGNAPTGRLVVELEDETSYEIEIAPPV